MIQLRFEDELRDPEKPIFREHQNSEKELDMAMSIIDQLTEKFDPSKYKDTYKDELMKLIKKKAATPKGKKLHSRRNHSCKEKTGGR
ncbi:MAG: hypothetical protein IPI60_14470 [Saprospiraceae bacterium]|nr:hypothetical protein [Saprospiraceae bacterium]